MSFPTIVEVAGYLRTDLDAEDAYTVEQLMLDAKAVIESHVGQKLESSTDTVTLDGTGTELLVLPRWPVTAITSVTVTNDDETTEVLVVETDYTWSANGILTRVGACWPTEPRSVAAVYTAGYAVISNDIKRIYRRLVAAGWHNPAGADEESSADHRVRWAAPGMELTTAEKRTLDAYAVR